MLLLFESVTRLILMVAMKLLVGKKKEKKEDSALLLPHASRFGLAVRRYRLVSGRTSVQYRRFGSSFSSKRLWFVDAVL